MKTARGYEATVAAMWNLVQMVRDARRTGDEKLGAKIAADYSIPMIDAVLIAECGVNFMGEVQ